MQLQALHVVLRRVLSDLRFPITDMSVVASQGVTMNGTAWGNIEDILDELEDLLGGNIRTEDVSDITALILATVCEVNHQ
jgi:hypothetical protein